MADGKSGRPSAAPMGTVLKGKIKVNGEYVPCFYTVTRPFEVQLGNGDKAPAIDPYLEGVLEFPAAVEVDGVTYRLTGLLPHCCDGCSRITAMIREDKKPASEGSLLVGPLRVDAEAVPCVYKVTGPSEVQIGDGKNPAIDQSLKGILEIPKVVAIDNCAYTVTSRADNCFEGCDGITQVVPEDAEACPAGLTKRGSIAINDVSVPCEFRVVGPGVVVATGLVSQKSVVIDGCAYKVLGVDGSGFVRKPGKMTVKDGSGVSREMARGEAGARATEVSETGRKVASIGTEISGVPPMPPVPKKS